ncbi:Dystonin [Dissostichus eleginoides]|uniref:Dystonin n=1 Tax=Dissostichus eleginoides TaxID=100907 RepID=A0AAD9F0V2_DISEL|nr:Dystonin [Dissostichus eleginoides]
MTVTFRKGPLGYLRQDRTDAARLLKDNPSLQDQHAPVKEAVVKQNALTVFRMRGGDASDRTEVAGEYILQFGKYKGKSFRWLLENDIGAKEQEAWEVASSWMRTKHPRIQDQVFLKTAEDLDLMGIKISIHKLPQMAIPIPRAPITPTTSTTPLIPTPLNQEITKDQTKRPETRYSILDGTFTRQALYARGLHLLWRCFTMLGRQLRLRRAAEQKLEAIKRENVLLKRRADEALQALEVLQGLEVLQASASFAKDAEKKKCVGSTDKEYFELGIDIIDYTVF